MTHLAIVGPTASGKTEVAIEIARANPSFEIVSMDSMQIYRGMDIGTAKPSAELRSAIPHHMVDIADPSESWSVAKFQHAARAAIDDIHDRGKRALLVGGTGLYFHAVVDDFHIPAQDLELRASLERRFAAPGGLASAYQELCERDPVAASRIEPNNARRIIRALEVIEISGQKFSSFGPGVAGKFDSIFPLEILGVEIDRVENAQCISDRVDKMIANGLLEETSRLSSRPWSRVARQAIGYKEMLLVLEGEISVDEAGSLIKSRTRKFARRQRAWFSRDPRVNWTTVKVIAKAGGQRD